MIVVYFSRGGVVESDFVWEAKSLAKSVQLSGRGFSLAWLGKHHCLQLPRMRRAKLSFINTAALDMR